MRHYIFKRIPRPQTSRGHQRGQAMVESALILLSLLMMVLFILDMGRVLFLQQFITERARATARAASVNNWDEWKVRGYFCYNDANHHFTDESDSSSVHNTTPGLLGITPAKVNYTVLGSANTPNYRVRVTVSNVSALMFIPYYAKNFTLPPIWFEFPAQSMGVSN
jgi:Flp pilus assembly protein TadG